MICASVAVARLAPGGLPRLSPAQEPGQRRRRRRLDSYTAGFGSGPDPGLPNVPSREADGVTDPPPQCRDQRERHWHPWVTHVFGTRRASASSSIRPYRTDPRTRRRFCISPNWAGKRFQWLQAWPRCQLMSSNGPDRVKANGPGLSAGRVTKVDCWALAVSDSIDTGWWSIDAI